MCSSDLMGYEIVVFNLIDPSQSDGYNPFAYIRNEADVLKLMDNLIRNTTPKNANNSDPFWEKAEIALDSALMLYLLHEAPPYEQNLEMITYLLTCAQVREEDDQIQSPLDQLFLELEYEKPDHIAVHQYKIFKQAAGKTAKTILVSAAVRLAALAMPQFAAMTFDLPDGSSYIAFRGTDATIVGWKEDFNMAFQYPVPSQAEAADYLNEAARHCRGKLYVGGHSKGGNLAVYAAANCRPDVSARLARVFSHDGPGFLEQALQSEAFRQVLPKIEKTLPQSSMIGMLLEHQENYKIVKSSSISIWQHNPFSWEINGDDFSYRAPIPPMAETDPHWYCHTMHDS